MPCCICIHGIIRINYNLICISNRAAENRFLKQQLEILNVQGVGEEVSPPISHRLVESIRGEISITHVCAWLEVPRFNYYLWKSFCRVGRVDQKFESYVQNINSVIDKRKITSLLRMEQQINHKRVQRIMQREGLQCRVKVKKRKPTGQPAHWWNTC